MMYLQMWKPIRHHGSNGYVDGTLLYIGVPAGEAAKVNQIIAIVGKEGEDYKSLLDRDGGGNSSNTAAAAAPSYQKLHNHQLPTSSHQPKLNYLPAQKKFECRC